MTSALIIIFLVALAASILTFFSGFGLGTILLPVMAFYFDIKVAIAATAIVHFSNNIVKGILLFSHIRKDVFLKFAIPALIGSIGGAAFLSYVDLYPIATYSIGENSFTIYLQELLVALLMLALASMEWLPDNYFRFNEKHLIPGGLLTGFTGGFTGMQGALRSSFLIQLKLTKEEFVATGTSISLVIDFCRISIYVFSGKLIYAMDYGWLILVGIAGALLGAILGKQLLKKTTYNFVKIITSICILLFSILLGGGLLH